MVGPSEDVWRRLPLPGFVVTWLSLAPDHGADDPRRVHLARLVSDRFLGTARYWLLRIARALRSPVCAASSAMAIRQAS
jgi:hypothetical protein